MVAKAKSIVGLKFNSLTVNKEYTRIRHHDSDGHRIKVLFVSCTCECGNTFSSSKSNVKFGHVKSCGCVKAQKSLVGLKFGKLLVVSKADDYVRESKKGSLVCLTRYLCYCDCGGRSIVRHDKLISGATQGCGCLKKRPSNRGEP